MLNFLKSTKAFYLLIVALLCANLCLIIYFFTQKTTFHVDEIWSYSYSNSTVGRNISLGEYQNTWIDHEQFHKYITVQKDDEFSFKHIDANLQGDMHTPLYYWIFYTINYFVPDVFSKWSGAGLNIFLWLLTLVVMYKLSAQFFENKYLIFAPLILYSFSLIGIGTVLYIRLYMLQTLLATLLFYTMILYYKDDTHFRHKAIFVFIFSLLGLLTSYNSLILSFTLSVVFGTYLLLTQKIDKLLYLALAMIASVSAFFAIFPTAWSIFTTFTPAVCHGSKDALEAIASALNIYFTELFNIHINVQTSELYLHITLIAFLYGLFLYFYATSFKPNKNFLLLTLSAIAINLYLSYTMLDMHEYQDRYTMFLFPLAAILTVYAVNVMIASFTSKRTAIVTVYILLLLNILNVNYNRYSPYLLQLKDENIQTLQLFKNKKLIVSSNTKWTDEVGSYLYENTDKVYYPSFNLYLYTTICYKRENAKKKEVRVTAAQIKNLLAEIAKGDYFLMSNIGESNYKYDANNVGYGQGYFCQELQDGLTYMSTINIGNGTFDLYRVNKDAMLKMADDYGNPQTEKED